MFEIEYGIFRIPLLLPDSLKTTVKDREKDLLEAQRRVLDFAERFGWEDRCRESFIRKAVVFDNKANFDKHLIENFYPGEQTLFPSFSATIENNTLFIVSPEIYSINYPDGIEDESYEKLIAHEMIHRLHIRILDGDEDAMGPIWFFEGFALYGAGQFEDASLGNGEILQIMEDAGGKRISYKKYSAVIRHLLKKIPLRELVWKAGKKNFIDFVKTQGF